LVLVLVLVLVTFRLLRSRAFAEDKVNRQASTDDDDKPLMMGAPLIGVPRECKTERDQKLRVEKEVHNKIYSRGQSPRLLASGAKGWLNRSSAFLETTGGRVHAVSTAMYGAGEALDSN
jgi:hypothetical protein